ncbi:MAG: diaminopimelate epimerase [Thermodesulfovibrionales bacterium]|nr:diaminopimelate epimerase [Thermodesulfovibrionales bacterium]
MNIPFTKMHGLGNDFIVIDSREVRLENIPALAQRLCDRRFGIGADQILLLEKSGAADFRMRIFNVDGSEVEMCGNGIRCLAKYVWDRNLSRKDILDIETLAGIIRPEKAGDMVKVDMGEPVFDAEKIPVHLAHPSSFIPHPSGGIVDYPLQIEDKEFRITCISMGNPHAVIFIDNVDEFPVSYYGPMIEHHQMFPKRTNVEFIEVIDPSAVKMRVWERGSGETMACGTGASAAAVAAHLKGLVGRNIVVHLLGGDLMLDWAGDNRVYMTGPAVEVFEGVFRS